MISETFLPAHRLLDMSKDQIKQNLEAKLASCKTLAREFPEGVTARNLREITTELEREIRKLESD